MYFLKYNLAAAVILVLISCVRSGQDVPLTVGNPYLPLWEHIPDGEPYIFEDPYTLRNNINPVVNNTDGSIVGYKYFNFDSTAGRKNLELILNAVPEGIDGTITVMADRPWTSQGGVVLGSIDLKAGMPAEPTDLHIAVSELAKMSGKHAVYLKFSSDLKGKSICVLNTIKFK